MLDIVNRYTYWLHGKWPSGTVEKLPLINADGTCALPGAYIVGDLTGLPLLKFSADTGAKAVCHIVESGAFLQRTKSEVTYDLAIVGGGVSGYAAALEAKQKGLSFVVIEGNESFATIANFPVGKPIFTYPSTLEPEGSIKFDSDVSVKEKLLDHLLEKIQSEGIEPIIASASHIEKRGSVLDVVLSDGAKMAAHRVIIAIGRSGNYRQLDIPGFHSDKVLNRLHDPKAYSGKDILVIGGGDSALETAVACAESGAHVTVSYRKKEFSRPKEDNLEKIEHLVKNDKLTLALGSDVLSIKDESVSLTLEDNTVIEQKNDLVFSMLGREAPLDFFRRSRIPIAGESTLFGWLWFAAFFLFIVGLYDWKNYGFLNVIWGQVSFPDTVPSVISGLGTWWEAQVNDRTTLIGVIATSMKGRSFYYTLAYTACIGIFGWRRIHRRKTAYVRNQTVTLFLVQLIPLFLLPEIILPWLGYLGAYDSGIGKSLADTLFPSYISVADLASHHWPDWGHPRAFWHAYGFILAWPLNVYNVFTPTPVVGWLVISAIQTFVIIPLIVYKWGKGAYCGWICSCGALAETMGDTHRHKMPHGPLWNKLNMLGQLILLIACVMLLIRIGGWLFPESWMHSSFDLLLKGENSDYKLVNPFSWKWIVDVLLGGILGVGLYFKFSGRVWCRFACPLAALMHIYARYSRFRIFSNKDKCISCNACTSVCHQGIDVMNFANKGEPMEDPECVRCSACVQTCPTGVLSFGEIDTKTNTVICTDRVVASPVHAAEFIEVKNVS
ncbi:MAG: NosR/NirI family nitrous oxide reductase transcriptional regulator [Lentisphaeria bacterium]|jgi:NosR/NirI family nitrous oxide reductase transcriptional regulator